MSKSLSTGELASAVCTSHSCGISVESSALRNSNSGRSGTFLHAQLACSWLIGEILLALESYACYEGISQSESCRSGAVDVAMKA